MLLSSLMVAFLNVFQSLIQLIIIFSSFVWSVISPVELSLLPHELSIMIDRNIRENIFFIRIYLSNICTLYLFIFLVQII